MMFSSEAAVSEAQVASRRRQHPRITLRSLAYVNLDEANGGIIRDLTETGIAIQSVAPLRPGQELNLRFDLLTPRVRVETRGRVCWAETGGQGGIEFCGLPPRMRQALKDWMLVQMLSAATLSGRDSIFADENHHLALSPSLRPAIVMEQVENNVCSVSLGVFSFSERTFSMFVDSLVLSCAVLLFSISAIVIMGGFPAWPLSTALFVTTTTIFIAVYHLLFSELLCGATPGHRLALLATRPYSDQTVQRFR